MNVISFDKIQAIEAYHTTFLNVLARDMDEALSRCRKARALSESVGYKKGVLDADSDRAWYHILRCEFDRAFPLLKDLPEKYKALGDDFGYLLAVNGLGVLHLDMGNYDTALPYFFKCLELARQKDEKEREASALANIGLLYDGMGKIEEAYDYFSEALNIPQLNDTCFYTASKCLGLYYIQKGEWARAEHYLAKAVDTAREKRDDHFESELLVTRGSLYRASGRPVEARACFELSLDICRRLGNKKIETENLFELGCMAQDSDDYDRARRYFDRVLALAEDRDIGCFICKAYEKLSLLHEQTKKYRQALACLKKFNAAEKEHQVRTAELKLKSLGFEHELEKKQQQAEIYRLKNIELEEANRKILRMANHDNLTGLPNRRLFMEHLKSAVNAADRNGTKFALLFIDLDDFKPVNDRFGHRAGDMILKAVAGRLTRALRKTDVVARFGGDEFVILVSELTGREYIRNIGDKIIRRLKADFSVGEHICRLGTSIGVSLYPDHDRDMEGLLTKADQAMYAAKMNGKNSYVFYD